MTGLIVCSVIAGLGVVVLAALVVYLRGFNDGYETAQQELTVELYALTEELKQPLDHIDAQRVAAREGLQ